MSKRASKVARLTVSLPADLVAHARQSAESRGIGVSAYVAEAIRAVMLEERRQTLIAGLLEDAEWHRSMAQ